MKKIITLLCLLLLVGCAENPSNLEDRLAVSVEAIALAPISDLADNNKPLYSYYIEPSVGRRTSTQTGNVFLYNGTEFVMNLNIASVINARFYIDELNHTKSNLKAMITQDGIYFDHNDLQFSYFLSIYALDNGKYFIDLDLAYVNFYAYAEYANIEDLVIMMFKIGKTVDIKADKIIMNYSSKPSMEYVKEKLELFEIIIPDSGRIEELMGIDVSIEGQTEIGDGIDPNVHDVYGQNQDSTEEID